MPTPILSVNETFFAGVDDMRAYFDRAANHPSQRRARLADVARSLLKRRTTEALATWLVHELGEALNTRAAILVGHTVNASVWTVLGRSGLSKSTTYENQLNKLSNTTTLHLGPEGMGLALLGSSGILAALWLEPAIDLDLGTTHVLEAIAGAAGMALEQALARETLTPMS